MKIIVIGLELYYSRHFYFVSKAKYQKKKKQIKIKFSYLILSYTELPQATDKLDHIKLYRNKTLYTSILTTLVKATNYIIY